MSQDRFTAIGPLELLWAAVSHPLGSLISAVVLTGVILAVTSARRVDRPAIAAETARAVRARYRPELRALGGSAVAVLVLFAIENVIRGYVVNTSSTVSWWRFAAPVLFALLGIAVTLGLIRLRGTTPPESPVLPAARRTWLSFGPRRGLVVALVVAGVLAATTVAAGTASAPDGEGRSVWLVIPVPNHAEIDPIRVPFYGWAYGVPVLLCLAALTAVTAATLRSNAARPYIRPDTVAAEREARQRVARGAVHIATAGMLLALAGAWRLIARAGSGSLLTIGGQNDGNPYEVAWRYAELAVAAGWCAPALEIAAFTLLLLLAARLLRRPRRRASAQPEVIGVEAFQ